MDFTSDLFNEVLNRSVAHVDNFIVSVGNFLVELYQFQCLTLKQFLASDLVDEYVRDNTILVFELCEGDAYVVLSRRLEFEVERKLMLT